MTAVSIIPLPPSPPPRVDTAAFEEVEGDAAVEADPELEEEGVEADPELGEEGVEGTVLVTVICCFELVVDAADDVDCVLGSVPVEMGNANVTASPLSVLVEVDPSSRTSSTTHSTEVDEEKWQSVSPPSCVDPAGVVVGKLDWAHPDAETTTVWIAVSVAVLTTVDPPFNVSPVAVTTFSKIKVVAEPSVAVPMGCAHSVPIMEAGPSWSKVTDACDWGRAVMGLGTENSPSRPRVIVIAEFIIVLQGGNPDSQELERKKRMGTRRDQHFW
jgi:hypothetical protein